MAVATVHVGWEGPGSVITGPPTVVEVFSGGGGGAVQVGRTLYVDAEYGSDTTGTADRADKPYSTLAAAKAAATSGETIVVRPGTYAGSNLWEGGVTWHFEPGATVNAPTDDTPLFVGVADQTCTVRGAAQFADPTGTDSDFATLSGANAALDLECRSITWATGGTYRTVFTHTAAGTSLRLKADSVTVPNGDFWAATAVALGVVDVGVRRLSCPAGTLNAVASGNFIITNPARFAFGTVEAFGIVLSRHVQVSADVWLPPSGAYLDSLSIPAPAFACGVVSGAFGVDNGEGKSVAISGAYLAGSLSVGDGNTLTLIGCRAAGAVSGGGTLVNAGSSFAFTPVVSTQTHGTLTDPAQVRGVGAVTGDLLTWDGAKGVWSPPPPPAAPTIVAANITDATARGRLLLTAATALECRDAIGTTRTANVYDYGAFGDGSQHPITAPEIAMLPAGVQPYVEVGDQWDYVALQWSALAAFGNPVTGVWNGLTLATTNRQWYIQAGDYLINKVVVIRDLCGGVVFGDGQFASSIRQLTTFLPSLRIFACAKSFFHNFGIEGLDITNDGVPGVNSNNNTQTNSFFRLGLSGGGSVGCGYGLRIDGRTSMGSENTIVECDIGGAWDLDGGCTSPITNGNHSTVHPAAGVVVLGQNALQNTIHGGNIASCRKGVYSDGGSVSGYHVGFQNYQEPPVAFRCAFDIANNANFPAGKYGNWDVVQVNSGVFEVDQWQGCRSESFRCVYARLHPVSVRGWTCAGWLGAMGGNTAYSVGDLAVVTVGGVKRLMVCTTAGTTGSSPNTDFSSGQPFSWNFNLATASGTSEWNMSDIAYFDFDNGSIDDISADGGGVILNGSGTEGMRIGKVRQGRPCAEAYRLNPVTPVAFTGLPKPQRTTPHVSPPLGIAVYLYSTPADVVTVDATGGAQTVFMPKASARDQLFVNVTGANAVTLQAYSGDTVTGSGTGLYVSDGVSAWVKV